MSGGVIFVLFFLCLMGFAGWLLYGYSFVSYCFGLYMAIISVSFLGIGFYCFVAGLVPRFSVDTNELVIQYGVYEGRITGSIGKLPVSPNV